MYIRPKRRKHKDNPYILEYIEEQDIYYVTFFDINKKLHKVRITKEVFQELDKYELEDLKELNEYDRHIEHSEIYENNLNNRMQHSQISIEEFVEKKIEIDNLHKSIAKLPQVQQRRLKKYYFDDKTLRQIAVKENCSYTAIKFSIDAAINNLRKELKKIKNKD